MYYSKTYRERFKEEFEKNSKGQTTAVSSEVFENTIKMAQFINIDNIKNNLNQLLSERAKVVEYLRVVGSDISEVKRENGLQLIDYCNSQIKKLLIL